MSELLDEIKEAFHEAKDEFEDENPEPVTVTPAVDLPPGTMGMRNYTQQVMLVLTRRIYRWFAGATMPPIPEELLKTTTQRMLPPTTNAVIEAFAAGVLIGHRSEHLVRLAYHVHLVDALFADEDFQNSARTMATGFRDDPEIKEFFTTYISGALQYLAHITGWAHKEQPEKVWDVWMICGISATSAAYLAGYRMGTSWYERDVLDGILIATEEITHGPEGADARDS
jgi:hypothetical protein